MCDSPEIITAMYKLSGDCSLDNFFAELGTVDEDPRLVQISREMTGKAAERKMQALTAQILAMSTTTQSMSLAV